MKQILSVILIGLIFQAPLMLSCGGDPASQDTTFAGTENEQQVVEEYERLKKETVEKDSAIYAYAEAINSIDSNLAEIREREKMVSINSASPELRKTKEQQIIEDIQLINTLMEKNRQKIASLSAKLKKANLKLDEFEKTIARLTAEIEKKDGEIAELKEQLTKANASLEDLLDKYSEQVFVNEDQQAKLNTAYYAFGTSKELIANKVLTKEGGLIGIGKTQKLAADFNKDYFTRIDITAVTKIDLAAKKAKLISNHPTSSYKIEGGERAERLVITDPQEFWASSKYLVIVVEN